MNGIPDGICWDGLLERTVEQVSIGRYQAFLALDDGGISIEGEYEVITENHSYRGSADDPAGAAPLIALVGLVVRSVSTLNKSTLEVCFDGVRLRLYDSHDSYESFRISSGGVRVVV